MEVSPDFRDSNTNGTESHTISVENTIRNRTMQTISMMLVIRRLSRDATMSIRMCSLSCSVHGAQSMNTAPNRYHCNSSQAFDDTPNILRTTALAAETRIATKMAQQATRPTKTFSASMERDRDNKAFMPLLPGQGMQAAEKRKTRLQLEKELF